MSEVNALSEMVALKEEVSSAYIWYDAEVVGSPNGTTGGVSVVKSRAERTLVELELDHDVVLGEALPVAIGFCTWPSEI